MSKFIPRNIKTSEASERPKDGRRLLSKRGSLDLNEKVNLLISSSMSNYNEILPAFSGTVNRFFSSTKASETQTLRVSHKSSSVSRNLSQDQPRTEFNKYWEISERIETLEIRLAQNIEKNPESKLLLWKNCSNEVISLVKRENSELASILNRLVKGFLFSLEEITNEFQVEQSRKVRLIQEQIEMNREKSEEINKLLGQIQEFKEVKLAEEWKIQADIKKLFGEYEDEQEVENAKARCEALLKNKPSGIVPLLKGVYKDMRKNRELPEFDDDEIDQPNPDDISKALRFNFSLILQASTKKAMNLLRKDVKTKLVSTQTLIACVSVEEYQELVKKLEKTSFSQQSLQIQLEKYRDELMAKIQAAEKAEVDKNQAFTQMLKSKREADVYLKELTALKKEFEKVSFEKDKAEKELDLKTQKFNKIQDKLMSVENKLKNLAGKTSLPQSIQMEIEKKSAFFGGGEEGFESELLNVNNEVFRYKKHSKLGMNDKRVNSKSNLYDTKPFVYDRNMGKKQMSKSNYSSRSSLMDDYIDYMNKPGISKIQLDSKTQKSPQKRSSINSNDNSPTSKATDTINEHKHSTEYNKVSLNPSKRASIKINIIQPNETEEQTESQNSPKNKKNKKNDKNDKKTLKRMSTKLSESNEKNSEKNNLDIQNEFIDAQRTIERDGKSLVLKDQSTCMLEKMSTFCSVSVQCGQNEDEDDSKKEGNSRIGIFHFNPNNYFGFRGDVFYNNRQVFVAQPKIPDCFMNPEKKKE